ncbi:MULTISPECIES: hypothetical protein [Cupriavidus]|uniref:Uncharacterized protein n=1 Tax=Cupriavidus pinatubonensis (strain JMP 134 / LMG 1197) TaxID=264198 RepID=Q475N6_CUPPJ|nr:MULTISPECIES: hypothetical protein [Cupriavidus]TPQ35556.1 hypothetical protein C2U69_20880 [Cupriavidus pinatubonensis]
MPAGRSLRQSASSRFIKPLLTLSLGAALWLGATGAMAQPIRVIPVDAPQAKLVVAAPTAGSPQTVTLDGKTIGVAPGLRVFGTDNQLQNLAAIAGQKLAVRYKLDLYGQLLTAWVLSEQEQKALKAKS